VRSFIYIQHIQPMKIKLNTALFLIGFAFILGFVVGIINKAEIICSN